MKGATIDTPNVYPKNMGFILVGRKDDRENYELVHNNQVIYCSHKNFTLEEIANEIALNMIILVRSLGILEYVIINEKRWNADHQEGIDMLDDERLQLLSDALDYHLKRLPRDAKLPDF